jgi:hypothetical protein
VFYGIAFRLPAEPRRNVSTYAGLGLLLALGGSRMALGDAAAAALWCALALVSVAAASPPLEWHGAVYLVAGMLSSGALYNGTRVLLGSGNVEALPAPILWPAAAGLVCYSLAIRKTPRQRLLRVVAGGASLWLVCAMAAGGLALAYHRILGAAASHAYCATFRTGILSAGAILLAWMASRWNWTELKPLVYAAVALSAYRLLLIDLGNGAKPALVLSLLFYGTALMLVPRWLFRTSDPRA